MIFDFFSDSIKLFLNIGCETFAVFRVRPTIEHALLEQQALRSNHRVICRGNKPPYLGKCCGLQTT
jgi:hypothetical protein